MSLVQYIHAYIFLLNICRSQLSLAIEVQLSKFVKNFENSILRRFLKPLPKHRSIFSENSKFLDVTVNVFSKKSITSLFVILEFLYSSFDPCEHIFLVSWKELLNVISNEKKKSSRSYQWRYRQFMCINENIKLVGNKWLIEIPCSLTRYDVLILIIHKNFRLSLKI